jgi:hypothetical protein
VAVREKPPSLCFPDGGREVKTTRPFLYSAGMLLLFSCLFACKVSDDAVAAARQMTATSAGLSAYYGAMAESLTDTISLNELNFTLFGVPFDAADRKQIEEARAEIRKRKELAESLARLSESMTALTKSKASSEVSTAATALGKEMVSIKALPSGSPVPDVIGKAAGFLMQMVQQHEEKKAAQAMDGAFAALAVLFAKEKPVYDSLDRQHIFLAKIVAASLIKHQFVDPAPLLQPALKPFGLSAAPPGEHLQNTLRTLAENRLEASAEDANQREADASAAMLKALQEMSSRVHLLATEKRMPARGNPFSLKVVESWAASVI